MGDLANQKCVPCEGGVAPLSRKDAEETMKYIPGFLLSEDGKHIQKEFFFKNFIEAMAYVNKVGDIAEREGHHPDISIHYNKVVIDLWTHAIGGLSTNDFIVAAKVNAL